MELTIDTSPPATGSVTIFNNFHRNLFINQDFATFRFKGFSDPHSGEDYFSVGIGTIEGMTDIVPTTKIHKDYLELNLNQLIDGHPYFIVVQVQNVDLVFDVN
ncbi:hypothetical protein DPMN_068329 [Dreissena polymorpha]|uniref:Uncharacterized protein n=1 Tax=Dreissena polymorpha TaxID=45954 RepID=A0A9D3YWY9_DREPO|nr:hypothetical protein DPMN_068329 [Dreissena polymorpha]